MCIRDSSSGSERERTSLPPARERCPYYSKNTHKRPPIDGRFRLGFVPDITSARFIPASLLAAAGGCPERGNVDHEAILDVVFEHPRVRFVDLLDRDHLNVRNYTVLGAEIEHLLRLPNSADPGSRERRAPADQREHGHGERGIGRPDHAQHSIAAYLNLLK